MYVPASRYNKYVSVFLLSQYGRQTDSETVKAIVALVSFSDSATASRRLTNGNREIEKKNAKSMEMFNVNCGVLRHIMCFMCA